VQDIGEENIQRIFCQIFEIGHLEDEEEGEENKTL
jgi:hypothetical protein